MSSVVHRAVHGFGLHVELRNVVPCVQRGTGSSVQWEGPTGLLGACFTWTLPQKKTCKTCWVKKFCSFDGVPIPHFLCLHPCYAVISCCLKLFRLETAFKRGCFWTIEQPRSSLLAMYAPFKDRFCCLLLPWCWPLLECSILISSNWQETIKRHVARFVYFPMGAVGASTVNLVSIPFLLNGNLSSAPWQRST